MEKGPGNGGALLWSAGPVNCRPVNPVRFEVDEPPLATGQGRPPRARGGVVCGQPRPRKLHLPPEQRALDRLVAAGRVVLGGRAGRRPPGPPAPGVDDRAASDARRPRSHAAAPGVVVGRMTPRARGHLVHHLLGRPTDAESLEGDPEQLLAVRAIQRPGRLVGSAPGIQATQELVVSRTHCRDAYVASPGNVAVEGCSRVNVRAALSWSAGRRAPARRRAGTLRQPRGRRANTRPRNACGSRLPGRVPATAPTPVADASATVTGTSSSAPATTRPPSAAGAVTVTITSEVVIARRIVTPGAIVRAGTIRKPLPAPGEPVSAPTPSPARTTGAGAALASSTMKLYAPTDA
jgi:hypothetical protein